MVYKKRKIKVFKPKKKKESIDVVIGKLKESYEQVTYFYFLTIMVERFLNYPVLVPNDIHMMYILHTFQLCNHFFHFKIN